MAISGQWQNLGTIKLGTYVLVLAHVSEGKMPGFKSCLLLDHACPQNSWPARAPHSLGIRLHSYQHSSGKAAVLPCLAGPADLLAR
jgi:hypothetical protein